jgi:hypothetical protein
MDVHLAGLPPIAQRVRRIGDAPCMAQQVACRRSGHAWMRLSRASATTPAPTWGMQDAGSVQTRIVDGLGTTPLLVIPAQAGIQ